MTGTNQRYQRPRRDSLDSLYSGAIEGCSRDHHPECYPELWQKVNQPTINGHEEDRNVTDPGRQPRPPPPPPVTPSNRTSSSSNSTNRSGGYKVWLIPNFSRKLLHKAGAEKEAAANKPSRKGKESPLTMEDRMFLMGIRRRRPEDAHEKEPSHPPPPAGTASSSAKRPVIGGFVTYPQIGGVHDPSRASGSPLVVANPDPGSKAERVRDDAVRDQRVPRTGHRSSSARSKTKTKTKAKAKGSSRGRLDPKYFLRLYEGISPGIQTAKRS